MLTTLSFAGISSLMALFITEPRLGLVTEDMTSTKRTQLAGNMAGLFIMTLAMSQFLSLGFLFQRIKKCLGLLHTGSIGCIMLGTGVGLIAFANDYRVLFATQSLVGFGNGFQTQVSTIFLSGFARPEFAARTWLSVPSLTAWVMCSAQILAKCTVSTLVTLSGFALALAILAQPSVLYCSTASRIQMMTRRSTMNSKRRTTQQRLQKISRWLRTVKRDR